MAKRPDRKVLASTSSTASADSTVKEGQSHASGAGASATTTASPLPTGSKCEARPLDDVGNSSSNPSASLCPHGCIGFVGCGIYLGSKEARLPELLKDQGITHVLAAGTSKGLKEYAQLSSGDFQLCEIVAADQEEKDMKSKYDQVKAFIREGTSGGNKILIHCAMGRSRSVSIIGLYLIEYEDLDTLQALLVLLSVRSDLRPQNSFIADMQDLEDDLNETDSFASFESPNLPGNLKRHPKAEELRKENKRFYIKNKAKIRDFKARRGSPNDTPLYRSHRFKDVCEDDN